MGDIFIIRSVVNTRVEQVQNFLHFSLDEQQAGFTIKKKQSRFENKTEELTEEAQQTVESKGASVTMKMTSIVKDLKIKFVNSETDKLIANVPFSV